MKKIKIVVDKYSLSGTLLLPENIKDKHPGILFIHGWASSKKNYIERAKPFVKKGFIALCFDLRGHGESDGILKEFSREDHLQDVMAAFDFLAAQKEVDSQKIVVCGSSYGGYLAAILTSKRSFPRLILRSPALYKDDDFNVPTASIVQNETTRVFRERNLSIDQSRALKALADYRGEVLLIESEKDTIIPHATIENYLKALRVKSSYIYKVISKADHQLSDPKWNRAFINSSLEWLEK